MADLKLRTTTLFAQIERVCDRFVKDSMPSTLEQAVGYEHKVEDYGLLYNSLNEFKDLADAYAEKIDKMANQLDSIQETIRIMNTKLQSKEE